MRDSLCQTGYRSAVIGIGSPMRGGDSVGPLAVQQVERFPAWAADPVDLLHQMTELDAVVIIDAALGPEVGKVDVWRLPEALAAILPEKGVSHILGLREALLLAEAMDGLPPFLRLVTIGIGNADHGAELDSRMLKAVELAALMAEDLLAQQATTEKRPL